MFFYANPGNLIFRKMGIVNFRLQMYTWVPQQSWDHEWTDEQLYKKYKLTKEEIDYIETVMRPMEIQGSFLDE